MAFDSDPLMTSAPFGVIKHGWLDKIPTKWRCYSHLKVIESRHVWLLVVVNPTIQWIDSREILLETSGNCVFLYIGVLYRFLETTFLGTVLIGWSFSFVAQWHAASVAKLVVSCNLSWVASARKKADQPITKTELEIGCFWIICKYCIKISWW